MELEKKAMYEACYGPKNVKILANYELVGKGGWFPQRNGKVISCSLEGFTP